MYLQMTIRKRKQGGKRRENSYGNSSLIHPFFNAIDDPTVAAPVSAIHIGLFGDMALFGSYTRDREKREDRE